MAAWWIKIPAKMVLSRLPVAYGLWARLRLFRHGRMDDSGYAASVLRGHLDKAFGVGRPAPKGICLEVGPGDSLYTAAGAVAAGFSGSVMVDAGDWATRDLEGFRSAALEAGIPADRALAWTSIETALADLNGRYLTQGLASLKTLADGSVDFIFSQAVLEHIRKGEYVEFIAETHRVLRPGGLASHRVDLQDHLDHSLNNMRFNDGLWESAFFVRSGFYTNRLGWRDHLKAFEDAGYGVVDLTLDRYPTLPLAREKLAHPFRNRPVEELMIHGFDLVVRKAGA